MLHGHLGNENVMGPFIKTIPDSYCIITPRAPIKLGEDQYSWHDIQPQWPKPSYYKQVADQLLSRLEEMGQDQELGLYPIDVMGFSQGAVLAYSLVLFYPERMERIASLSGFIPHSWQKDYSDRNLEGKKMFIAHGKRDEVVPISSARKAAEWLTKLGASVTFCESNTGHKIGVNCVLEMEKFFRSQD